VRLTQRIFFILSLIAITLLPAGESLPQEKDWHEEFKYLCSMVDRADSLNMEELNSLIARSDALLKTLETINEPSKKVYIFRLKKCRAFFQYVIELKSRQGP